MVDSRLGLIIHYIIGGLCLLVFVGPDNTIESETCWRFGSNGLKYDCKRYYNKNPNLWLIQALPKSLMSHAIYSLMKLWTIDNKDPRLRLKHDKRK